MSDRLKLSKPLIPQPYSDSLDLKTASPLAGAGASQIVLKAIRAIPTSYSLVHRQITRTSNLYNHHQLLAKMTKEQQTWFITGCSSGFGEQFVRQLRARGDNVIATGRNAETKLAHLKDTGATILELDVTAPQEELNAKFQQAIDIYGGVDVLVNNAGYIQCGAIEELT